MERLKDYNENKIPLEMLQRLYKIEEYGILCEKVKTLVDKKEIQPIKASGLNGKYPALYKRYRIVRAENDESHYKEELQYGISTRLKIDYYLNHISKYKEDRTYVLLLNDYLKASKEKGERVSINERSFDIWGREKYLKQEGGVTLLKRLGLSLEDLNVYETSIPIAYYTHHKKTPQNVLIVENMDTFYSMRQHLMIGNDEIVGKAIGSLVYGAGKQIVKGFGPFIKLGEAYLRKANNKFLYFGDLDYEGISIYESLLERAQLEDLSIEVCTTIYEKMLDKTSEMIMNLPPTKEKQKRVEGEIFFSFFKQKEVIKMKEILEQGNYIPQEILNRKDF